VLPRFRRPDNRRLLDRHGCDWPVGDRSSGDRCACDQLAHVTRYAVGTIFDNTGLLISLALSVVSTVVLLHHMPTVSKMARSSEGADLRALGGDLFYPGVGLLLLLAITVLNVSKPTGPTPYGWRKQREQAPRRARRPQPVASIPSICAREVQPTSSIKKGQPLVPAGLSRNGVHSEPDSAS
jgi:hypothetical protein